MKAHIIGITKQLRELPYDPECWTWRGQRLLDLGYPELAIGDAYKAGLLVGAMKKNDTTLGENALLMYGMRLLHSNPGMGATLWTGDTFKTRIMDALYNVEVKTVELLVNSLYNAHAFDDAERVCQIAAKQFPQSKFFRGSTLTMLGELKQRLLSIPKPVEVDDIDYKEAIRNGGVSMRIYPWISSNLIQRDDAVIQRMKKNLRSLSTKCEIKESSVDGPSAEVSQGFGIFATEDVAKGDVILTEYTVTAGVASIQTCSACCKPLGSTRCTSACCKELYCSQDCVERAAATFHSSVCGKDFSYIYDLFSESVINSPRLIQAILEIRVYAAIVQEQATHPLQSWILAPLQAQYQTQARKVLNLQSNYVWPIQALQTLGIDPFADHNWDTWVLFTIFGRIGNNIRRDYIETGDEYLRLEAINPLFSFLNHSCDPNVGYTSENNSTLIMAAKRDIRKGEELAISYIGYDLTHLTRAKRQKKLRTWVGRECLCSRCEIEK